MLCTIMIINKPKKKLDFFQEEILIRNIDMLEKKGMIYNKLVTSTFGKIIIFSWPCHINFSKNGKNLMKKIFLYM